MTALSRSNASHPPISASLMHPWGCDLLCRDITKQLYAKILELRAQHDEAWIAFKKAEDEFRAWREKDRQRKCALYHTPLLSCRNKTEPLFAVLATQGI